MSNSKAQENLRRRRVRNIDYSADSEYNGISWVRWHIRAPDPRLFLPNPKETTKSGA